MKSVERVVSLYKTNSQMGRGANSRSTLDYFEGEKNKSAPPSGTKKAVASFSQILESQIKKST